MNGTQNTARGFLRHALAAVAYRGGKVLRDPPEGFEEYTAGPTSRTPGQILAHMCDLYGWIMSLCTGEGAFTVSKPGTWEEDTARFFSLLERFDALLASEEPIPAPLERLFQGPVADSLTHIGQLAMLRRMANAPIRAEDFFSAKMEPGRVGTDQNPPVYEFD